MESFNLSELYKKAFGINHNAQTFDSSQIKESDYLNTGKFETPQSDESEFSYFKAARKGVTFNGSPVFMPVWIGGLLLENEPVLSISMKKRIQKTYIQGVEQYDPTGELITVSGERYGSIKEFLGLDDTEIVIRGIVINNKSKKVYPEDSIFKLSELVKRNESLTLTSGLTNLLGIKRVIIESLNFPPMVGVQHAQAYEITCFVDSDFDIVQDDE
jgi:Domain of unknown function (DUF6046)